MSHAVAALAALRAAIEALPLHAGLRAEPPPSRKMLVGLNAADAAPMPPEPALRALRQRLEAAIRANGGSDLARRDLRSAPFVLWDTELAAPVRPRLLDLVLRHARTSDATLRNLIEAWLLHFDPASAQTASAGAAIAAQLRYSRDPRLSIWATAHRQFQLFDHRAGPAALAKALLGGPGDGASLLAETGFDDPLRAASGYLKAAQQAMLAQAPAAFRSGRGAESAERLIGFVAPARAPRFRDTRHAIGKALLRPWLDGGMTPAEPVRDVVRGFLLHTFADPRVKPQNWSALGEAETAVVRRWLARASLKTFFRIIADYALDSQWRYREAFWTACLDRGVIDDAQLALAGRVHASARATRELGEAVAKLEGSGVQSNHSVLLLRVGPLVFCEWSHLGKLRVWSSDWKTAPKLDRSLYERVDLMELGLPFPPNHFGRGATGLGLVSPINLLSGAIGRAALPNCSPGASGSG